MWMAISRLVSDIRFTGGSAAPTPVLGLISAVPEVAACVPNTDDPSVPCNSEIAISGATRT